VLLLLPVPRQLTMQTEAQQPHDKPTWHLLQCMNLICYKQLHLPTLGHHLQNNHSMDDF
jgi:hypothetical protein